MRTRRLPTTIGRYAALIAIALVTLFPIVWIILSSFKGQKEIGAIPPSLWVQSPTLQNFVSALQTGTAQALGNSLLVAVASTAITMAVSIPAAYAFARHPFPGSRALLTSVLVVRMIPSIALDIPFYRLMQSIHLINSPAALIITYLSFEIPFAMWLLEGFFRALPQELEEAGLIDGCTRFQAFVKIMLPLSSAGIASAAIFCFILSWNEFLYAVTLTSTTATHTGPVNIASFITSYDISWGPMAASAVMFVVPVLAVSMFFQRFIVRGLTLGAVKG